MTNIALASMVFILTGSSRLYYYNALRYQKISTESNIVNLRTKVKGNMSLLEKIEAKNFVLSVVGAGRVGLPLAISFANRGVKTYAIDVNDKLIESLQKNIMPFKEKNLKEEWEKARSNRKLFLTSKCEEAIPISDVIVISVGTPLTPNFEPDLSSLISASKTIAHFIRDETLVIIRSTVPPTTTKNLIIPLFQKESKSDPYVAMCPERIVEGQAFEELRELPEIVGGMDTKSAQLAGTFFRLLDEKKLIIETDTTSAEVAKLFSNVYRYVNFAVANEFAILADEMGLNGRKIVEMANQSYKRGGIPKPAPTGGPCLSKDGHFLIGNLPFIDFIRAAWHLNESIPQYIVNRLKKAIGGVLNGVSVGILGIAYKAGSDDTRYSPAVKIAECLKTGGSIVHVHDPYIPSTESLRDVLEKSEVLVFAVNHPEFKSIPLESIKNAKVIFDCWGILDDKQNELSHMGCKYMSFGGGQKI